MRIIAEMINAADVYLTICHVIIRVTLKRDFHKFQRSKGGRVCGKRCHLLYKEFTVLPLADYQV